MGPFRTRRCRGGFPYGHGLVTGEVEADDLRHRAGRSVAKMTAHNIAGHFPEFIEHIALACSMPA